MASQWMLDEARARSKRLGSKPAEADLNKALLTETREDTNTRNRLQTNIGANTPALTQVSTSKRGGSQNATQPSKGTFTR